MLTAEEKVKVSDELGKIAGEGITPGDIHKPEVSKKMIRAMANIIVPGFEITTNLISVSPVLALKAHGQDMAVDLKTHPHTKGLDKWTFSEVMGEAVSLLTQTREIVEDTRKRRERSKVWQKVGTAFADVIERELPDAKVEFRINQEARNGSGYVEYLDCRVTLGGHKVQINVDFDSTEEVISEKAQEVIKKMKGENA